MVSQINSTTIFKEMIPVNSFQVLQKIREIGTLPNLF